MKKKFKLTKVFDKIILGSPIHKNKIVKYSRVSQPSYLPYVTRKTSNNGIELYVPETKINIDKISKGNCITIGAEGFQAYYQEERFITGNKVNIMYSNKLNKYNALYLCTILNFAIKNKFNYGRGLVLTRLKNLEIELPSKNYEPDFNAMEEEIKKLDSSKNIEKNKTETSKVVTSKKLKLEIKEWKPFEYRRIFTIKKGKRKVMSKLLKKGNTAFISAIDSNNGVKFKTNIKPNHKKNTITVNYNGSVGESFYQPEDFWASDDVNVLYPKFDLNIYNAFFLITLLRKEKHRFNYGRKWHKERMDKSIIRLPVDSKGEPDWKFMEEYIKSLPYSASL